MAESSPTSPRRTRIKNMSPPPYLSEKLQCSVCLDLFNDPVSTSCGHNFCNNCLDTYWDNSQIYSCPYCKETFSKRPELKINTTLREITLIFKEKFSLRRSEVLCEICDERKLKALKSCLMCQTSYCETHLEPHQRVLNLKKHKLMDPVDNIKDYICEKHERPLELFCRDDQTCVCVFCTDGDHKNHNTVPLVEETKEIETQLKKMQQYAVDVTLDPDTALPELILSKDRKQVKHGDIWHKLPDNPERFDRCISVLGKEGFNSGRFYFEVQVKDKTNWDLGVVSESIKRKGSLKAIPQEGFWIVSLRNNKNYLAFAHTDIFLSLKVKPQKVGVFVDYEEGLVCFHDVESMSHIYSFAGQTFTKRLFPYFCPCHNNGGRNSAPLVILPLHYNK
nr:E3 ubiquitin-protein ligase TRIM69-like [Misgurnus anguillicaudatus]XP_055033110.1 E3 ubiquitin-protein ligase TRIM69-like [Misgurnus anguillicaudatus]XP_055033189.1 E3 ubiquitin-protein ligase TRIM69-like [Misgurnus anguillicaudatus]